MLPDKYREVHRYLPLVMGVLFATTYELMTRFYKKMLQDKLAPAVGLRSAQIEVPQVPEWQSPYYWAAFGLQGEWN